MKKLTLMAVIVALIGMAAGAQNTQEVQGWRPVDLPTVSGDVATGSIRPITSPIAIPANTASFPEKVYSVTEFEEAQKSAERWEREFDALLLICQQQRAERELIVSAILQAVTAGDYQRVAEIVRQITVASLVSVGNGGGQK